MRNLTFGYNSNGYMFEPEIILEYILIGIGLICIYWICVLYFKMHKSILNFIAAIFCIFYISLIPLTFVACFKLNTVPWEWILSDSRELITLSDNNLISQYGYRRCIIDEKLYYQFLYYDNNGNVSQGQVPAYVTTIKYDDRCRLETYDLSRSWGLLWWQIDTAYILYIPEENIIKDFSIDLATSK